MWYEYLTWFLFILMPLVQFPQIAVMISWALLYCPIGQYFFIFKLCCNFLKIYSYNFPSHAH